MTVDVQQKRKVLLPVNRRKGRGPASLTPPECLDPKYKYNVVKDGKLIGSTDCVHNMRRKAMFKKAQLWFIQSRGHAPLLVEDYGR